MFYSVFFVVIECQVLLDEKIVIIRLKASIKTRLLPIVKFIFQDDFGLVKKIRWNQKDKAVFQKNTEILLKTASIKPEQAKKIDSINIKSGRDEDLNKEIDLRDTNDYKEYCKEGIINCWSIIVNRDLNLESFDENKETITIFINFNEGHFYFNSELSENETIEWCIKLIRSFGSELRPRKSDKDLLTFLN